VSVRLSRVLFIANAGLAACASPQSPATSVAGRPASVSAAGAQQMAYGGGDGTSCDQAVVVKDKDEIDGVMSEYAWLAARHPNYTKRYQAQGRCKDHPVDKVGIRTADGADLEIVFDISAFFGKF
jgi:hypothetical protein